MKRWMIFVMCCALCFQSLARQFQTFEENGKVGMKDNDGHVVIPPSFEALGWSDGNFSVVGEVTGYRLQGLWGIINLKKEFVTKADYEKLVYAGGESIVARKNINSAYYKTGLLNLRGENKIPFEYDGIEVQGLRAIVFNLSKSGYRYGLIDINNRSILPMNYKYIRALGTLRYAVENDEGKIALFNEAGAAVTSFAIDSVSEFYRGYAVVYQDHLQGLIDRDGIAKLETKYQAIKIGEDGRLFAQLPNEWSFLNEENKIVNRFFADELKTLNDNFFYFKKGPVWGVINDELKQVIPPHYQHLTTLTQGRFLATIDSKHGVIDDQNKIVVPFLYDSLIQGNDLLCALTKSQGWQLIDLSGRVLTDHFYRKMTQLGVQNFLVESKGFYGLINKQGKEFIHCVFDSAASPIGNLIEVKFKGKYGIINVNEDWVVAPQDFPLQIVNDRMYLQCQPENQFLKTYSGETKYFTPYKLKFNADDFTETLPNGIEKVVSYEGLIIHRTSSPDKTEEIFRESEGLRGIRKDDRYGFVDVNGRLRVANRYDSIGEFHEGLAAVKLIGKWGFVNTNDRVVINPNYDEPAKFSNALAIVSRNKKFGVIDKNGNTVLPLRYDNVLYQTNAFLITAAKLNGLADLKGNVTIEPRFDQLQPSNLDLLIACRDNKCGVITKQGLNVIPMIYDQLIFNKTKNIFVAERISEWKEIVLD